MSRNSGPAPGWSRASSAARATTRSCHPDAGEHVEAPLSKQVLVFSQGRQAVRDLPGLLRQVLDPDRHRPLHLHPPGTRLQLARHVLLVLLHSGYAVHGYDEVPNYPASHGCLRTFIADQPRDLRTAPLRRGHLRLVAMRVFVAGASGAIGRPLVRQLVAAGHEVTGMTRREERAEKIRAAGAEAVVCDVFDAEALREAVVAARPEAVVHALTALPPALQPRATTCGTNRMRVEGRATWSPPRGPPGRAAGRREHRLRLPAQGDWAKDEEAPLFADAPGRFGAPSARSPSWSARCSGPRGWRGWSCATAGSTAPAPTTAPAAQRPRK